MYKLLITFFALSFSTLMAASNVSISGKAKSFPGQTISAMVIEDYISEKRRNLQSAEISVDGEFHLNLDITEIRVVILCINRIEGIMYLEPGKSYQVIFPSDITADIKKFDRTEVEIEIENSALHELNELIRNFNADFLSFLNLHFYDFAIQEYQGSDVYLKTLGAKKIEADIYSRSEKKDSTVVSSAPGFSKVVYDFSLTVEEKYGKYYTSEFFRDYVKYSLAELELMGGMNRNSFYAEYFMSHSLKLLNPAFMRCFDLFYNNFLVNRTKEKQAMIVKAVNQERDAGKIIDLFESDSSALSVQIRTLAVIKGLKDIYFNKTFTRDGIEKTLYKLDCKQQDLNAIVINTRDQLRKCKEGWMLEDFILVDESSEKWMLSDHYDAPTYLLFFATWSSSSLKELQMMKNIQLKYGNDIRFVAICMDEQYGTFRKYVENNADQKFTFLFAGGDPMLSDKCCIRSLPHALMLDIDGKVMFTFTKKPSEGIQMDFDKIISIQNQEKKGPKTWRE